MVNEFDKIIEITKQNSIYNKFNKNMTYRDSDLTFISALILGNIILDIYYNGDTHKYIMYWRYIGKIYKYDLSYNDVILSINELKCDIRLKKDITS